MPIRREPTYLSREVWRALYLVAQARSTKLDDQGLHKITTADEMADDLLRELITEKYPQLLEHQKAVAKLEKEVIKTLGGDSNTSKPRRGEVV
jgi:hypothetical protein